MKFQYASGSRPLDGYTVKRGVGRGGFGEVYYAVSDAGKEVALKLIRRNLEVELRGVSHCLNLKHPNLVALYDVRTDEQDNSWVIMEFVNGESLDAAIERQPSGMPLGEALLWMRGICAGVQYLHDRGIVHRDLKPGNIFLDEGLVKLGDYGLAKFISCSRRSGQTESVGTVHYMAPEVANGRYGKEIDLYALGVILYEMLTGRVPFEGESVGEVLMKHLTAEPDLTRLAEPLRTIVARLLAKDPERRYRSVVELLADLPPATGSQGAAAAQYAGPTPGPATVRPPESAARPAELDEPLMDWAGRQVRHLGKRYWHASTPVKIVVLVLGIYVLGAMTRSGNIRGLETAATAIAIGFGVYFYSQSRQRRREEKERLERWGRRPGTYGGASPASGPVRPQSAPPGNPGANPAVSRAAAMPAAMRTQTWGRHAALRLPARSLQEFAAELLGSMLATAGVVAALSLVMLLLRAEALEAGRYAWLTLTSILGAWIVLVAGAAWSGKEEDSMPRRFTLMVFGVLLGLFSFGLLEMLRIQLPNDMGSVDPVSRSYRNMFYAVDGSPLAYLYMVYFGMLMFVVRWWRQVDPLRKTRVSLLSALGCVGVAFVLNLIWQFPQPWGYMTAATISLSAQLASPWVTPAQRQALWERQWQEGA